MERGNFQAAQEEARAGVAATFTSELRQRDAAALAVSAGSTSVDASRYSLAEYVEAHEMYATVSKAAADALKAACAGAFVHSTVFGGAKATVRTDA